MKQLIAGIFTLMAFTGVYAQTGNYANDVKTAEETIKKYAFKNNYKYFITYAEVKDASVAVTPTTDYLIFYVYNNSSHPATTFKGYLMTPDNKLKTKYTATPDDIGQTGLARVERLKFTTPKFASGKDKLPVKLEASPAATIYVFYRN
jgi:hypothetical protein